MAYRVWAGAVGQPAETNHIFRQHPDWLDRNVRGETYTGRDFYHDPAHPEVQKHIFKVAMDIISRYDVDGLT